MNIKGLLFDLDGVIVDTAKYHYIAWKEIAEELGVNFTLEDNELLKGVSRTRSLQIILEIGKINLSGELQAEICERKNQIYLAQIKGITGDEILPGVRKFLIDSKEKGYKIALGSASKNSIFILNQLQLTHMFDSIIDGTKVSKAKPDPEVFKRGAKELGLRYEHCIVFEDAVAGVEAAHRIGMKVVGVGSKKLLPKADLHIPGFEHISIESLLEKLEP
ncbi:beta-phosphoglucomutase [Robertmurraya sp. P23]|uniref:beta-phosphoglucomutase n=1 Tax=Robertmurraya sp. P23 TaxID=3436931 RepID=UPI003D968BC7